MNCFRCGECCEKLFNNLKVSAEELRLVQKRTGRYLDRKKIYEGFYLLKGEGSCPFLKKTEDGTSCEIYDIRFCHCRMYHCGRINKDDPVKEALYEIRDLILNNPEYAKYKTEMEDEAVSWGNQHGWKWRRE